jgi:hypothetical protein
VAGVARRRGGQRGGRCLSTVAQDIPLEYRVKAAYLFNFLKYVEWPDGAVTGPFTICVAGRNPFGAVLAETVNGERIGERTVMARVVAEPDPACHVLFVPRTTTAGPYLRGAPRALTVGESADFLGDGGAIVFVQEGANVRFQINEDAAARAGLRISSRLLRLSRGPATR